jgi:hypothetical protein
MSIALYIFISIFALIGITLLTIGIANGINQKEYDEQDFDN